MMNELNRKEYSHINIVQKIIKINKMCTKIDNNQINNNYIYDLHNVFKELFKTKREFRGLDSVCDVKPIPL